MKRLSLASVSVLALSASAAFADWLDVTPGNESHIASTGSNNAVTVDQLSASHSNGGDGNLSNVTQTGNYNGATITQAPSASYAPRNSSNSQLTQTGSNNTATISQSGQSNKNKSDVSQTGNGSTVTVRQEGGTEAPSGGAAWGTTNISGVDQSASNSTISIFQTGGTTLNQSTAIQASNDSHITVEQRGYYPLKNYSYVDQQYGDDNTAAVFQTSPNVYFGSANNLTIYQGGDSNYTNVSQTATVVGQQNNSLVSQYGSANSSYIRQH